MWKILGLNYPAGPHIDRLSSKGDSNKFSLPIARVKDFDFSYSGVKTAFQNLVKESKTKDPNFIKDNIYDLCASLQKCLVESVIRKIDSAAKKFSISEIVIGGGVSANSELRRSLKAISINKKWKVHIPPIESVSYTHLTLPTICSV